MEYTLSGIFKKSFLAAWRIFYTHDAEVRLKKKKKKMAQIRSEGKVQGKK